MGGIGGFGYTMVSSMLTVFAAACRMFALDMVMVCFRGWIVCCDTGEWYKLFGVLYQGSFKFWFGRPRLARRGRGESMIYLNLKKNFFVFLFFLFFFGFYSFTMDNVQFNASGIASGLARHLRAPPRHPPVCLDLGGGLDLDQCIGPV
jgi:hypothetical protein